MTTKKQIAANRKNAQLGGVKSEAGKNKSKMNAVKHGLLSKECLVKDESRDELLGLVKELRHSLKPEGALQQLLVDRITVNAWRLRRALRAESIAITNELDAPPDILEGFGEPPIDDKTRTKRRYVKAISGKELERLQRYETGIERSMFRSLYELRLMQESEDKMGSFRNKEQQTSEANMSNP